MDGSKTIRLLTLVILQFICIVGVDAFRCKSCSYSVDDPSADTACIHQPDVFTGWQVLDCKDYCIVQETYNKVQGRVVAYWRSCTDKKDTDYCIGDQLLTCVHTCQGDFCNSWVRGQLHQLFGSSSAAILPEMHRVVLTSVCVLICWLVACWE